MPIYLIATLDTKGPEAALARRVLQSLNLDVVLVDAGCLNEPAVEADISREAVFEAAETSLGAVREQADRGNAITLAAQGASQLIHSAWQNGELEGVLGLGGSAGTTIATAAMRRLPLGVPKMMLSTMASGQTRPYVGSKDICMLNSVVDIAGINRISETVIHQAATAVAGMVRFADSKSDSTESTRPIIAASMFGVTTPCVQAARAILEEAGYEVLVFHATGNGGEAMESLIDDGLIAGVLDITTTELADELVGGVLSAGPERLTAAARNGVPQVVSVGATDMVNFGPVSSIPDKFQDRTFYEHNPTVTLMRTTPEENEKLGHEIAEKVNASSGPVRVLFPRNGVSAIDAEGQPFDSPDARNSLLNAIEANVGSDLLEVHDLHINDPDFAESAARTLLALIEQTTGS